MNEQLNAYAVDKAVRHMFAISRSAELRADPHVVPSGGTVAVSWAEVVNPSSDDWVGLFCPSSADPRAYLEYVFVTESATYAQGRGRVHFTLYKVRTRCEFRYYRRDAYDTLVAASNRVSFEGAANQPLQGHLALTGSPAEMRVSWTTGSATESIVLYGLSSKNLSLSATGSSKTYKKSDLCGPQANDSIYFFAPGYMHDVLLTDLQPKTVYFYKFGSNGSFSEVKSFKTGIPSGDVTPFKFIMYGDMGLFPAAVQTARLVLEEVRNGAEFVVHQGDLSYARGHAITWDMWMSCIEPYASRVPYMVCIGNHEYDHTVGGSKDPSYAKGEGFHPEWGNYGNDSGGECGVPTFYRFSMPDTGHSLWWYSYNYGLVHFTLFSTEHDFMPGSSQHQWLEQDLKSVDRQRTPWLIVIGHRAMYSSEKRPSEYKIVTGLQDALEELFNKEQVDLAVWGHYHAYERTCAVYKQKCNSNGTVNIVVGSAGYERDTAGTYDAPWSLYFEADYGYLRVSVPSASSLLVEYVRNSDSKVADHTWLYK